MFKTYIRFSYFTKLVAFKYCIIFTKKKLGESWCPRGCGVASSFFPEIGQGVVSIINFHIRVHGFIIQNLCRFWYKLQMSLENYDLQCPHFNLLAFSYILYQYTLKIFSDSFSKLWNFTGLVTFLFFSVVCGLPADGVLW